MTSPAATIRRWSSIQTTTRCLLSDSLPGPAGTRRRVSARRSRRMLLMLSLRESRPATLNPRLQRRNRLRTRVHLATCGLTEQLVLQLPNGARKGPVFCVDRLEETQGQCSATAGPQLPLVQRRLFLISTSGIGITIGPLGVESASSRNFCSRPRAAVRQIGR